MSQHYRRQARSVDDGRRRVQGCYKLDERAGRR